MRFLGNIEGKTDQKGRVFLPAAFRKQLAAAGAEGLVLRKDVFQPCLTLYPDAVWNAQMDALRARLDRWNAAHQQLFRQFVADVELLSLDAGGRILVPKRFQQMAGIQQAVRFIGMGDTIELWAADAAQGPFMPAEEFAGAMQELLSAPAILNS